MSGGNKVVSHLTVIMTNNSNMLEREEIMTHLDISNQLLCISVFGQSNVVDDLLDFGM